MKKTWRKIVNRQYCIMKNQIADLELRLDQIDHGLSKNNCSKLQEA